MDTWDLVIINEQGAVLTLWHPKLISHLLKNIFLSKKLTEKKIVFMVPSNP